MRLGIPRLLTSDNGKEFKNHLDAIITNLLSIKRIFITHSSSEDKREEDGPKMDVSCNLCGIHTCALYVEEEIFIPVPTPH